MPFPGIPCTPNPFVSKISHGSKSHPGSRSRQVYCSGDREDLIGAEVTISGGTFGNNQAEELGGAIVAWGTTVTVLGGLFEGNYAR